MGASLTDTITDTASAKASPYPFAGVFVVATERMRATARPTQTSWRIFAQCVDKIVAYTTLRESGFTYHFTINEKAVRVTDATYRFFGTLLAAKAIAGTSMQARIQSRLREGVKASAAVDATAFLGALVRDRARAIDKLIPGYSTYVLDNAHAIDYAAAIRAVLATVAEHVQVRDHFDAGVRFIVYERDDIVASDDTLQRMFYEALLVDQVECFVDFFTPTNSSTQWAMNARSGGVTEYRGAAFNSYARFGDGYIAASDEGLFELQGDSDGGVPIVADILSGIHEMTGSYLTGLQAAYVAIRGEGEFLLKISGGGRSTTFRARPSSMQSARINLGKGWRARYLQWELIALGEDFDFQGIEFLPVASKRRV